MRIHAILFSLVLLLAVGDLIAAEYYVAPDGQPDNAGTRESPWDIASAWSGEQDIEPGDTLYMLGGTYRHPEREWRGGTWTINLAGTQEAPIHIRPVPGERVTIDAGVNVTPRSHHLWMWDLEITISEADQWDRRLEGSGSDARPPVDQPRGGLTIQGGQGAKFINLIVHTTNSTGIGFWRGASNDAELHGCIIYNNGWVSSARYHGPGIYTQNRDGNKWITDCILWGNYSTTIQAYGSRNAWVDGYRIIGNISFAPVKEGRRQRFLIGGGRPSHDIVVSENVLYEVPLQIGYNAPHNEDVVVHDNIVVNAGMRIVRYREVDEQNNLVIGSNEDRPDKPADVVLRPNKYDPDRANLAILNWQRQPQVDVDLSSFLQEGDRYRIVNVLDYFGQPVAQGTYTGDQVAVPVPASEQTGNGAFCAYVVFRESR